MMSLFTGLGVLSLFACLLVHAVVVKADVCDTAFDIGNERRSTAFIVPEGDPFICDLHSVSGVDWYSLESDSGGMIPELPDGEIIELDHCGTRSPMWIKGINSHPEVVGDEVQATICTNFGAGCDFEDTITIRKCPNNKYVYNLTEVISCPTAYCAGNYPVCENPAEFYDPETEKCQPRAPVMDGPPTLIGPLETVSGGPFYFKCSIKFTPEQTGPRSTARFRVKFLFDGVESPEGQPRTTPFANQYELNSIDTAELSVELEDVLLLGRLGKELSCSVQSFWHNRRDDITEPWASNTYYVGLKYEPDDQVSITDANPEATVLLVSTIPVVATPAGNSFPLDVLNPPPNQPILENTCTYRIYPHSWIGFQGEREDVDGDMIHITSESGVTRTNMGSAIRFEPMAVSPDVNRMVFPVWHGYQFDPLSVHVNRRGIARCYSYTDPHFITFDGRRTDCYDLGEYYMVKGGDSRIFEVQASFWRWSDGRSSRSCNCGVAVREGNQILGVTMCQTQQGFGRYPVRKIRYMLDESTPRGHITQRSNIYTIHMPSGAHVIATTFNDYMNVEVFPHPRDRNNVEGLCGNYDGNPNNDALPQNGKCPQYRVPFGSSFFGTAQRCVKHEEIVPRCECETETGANPILDCDPDSDVGLEVGPGRCGNRRKRSIVNGTDFPFDDNEFSEEDIFVHIPHADSDPVTEEWPTPSGITELQAETACQSAITRSPVYNVCEDQVDTAALVESCMKDALLGDDLTFVNAFTTSLESECTFSVESEIVIESDDPEKREADLAPLRALERDICPNQCSGEGSCNDGACTCNPGFTRADCSMSTDAVPEVMTLRNGGLCDRRERPCQTIRMFADYLDDSQKLTCRVKQHEIQDQDLIGTLPVPSVNTEGTVFTNMEVGCSMPEATVRPDPGFSGQAHAAVSMKIEISNDGTRFSDPVEMTIYDSLCVSCTDYKTCYQKNDACLINGLCQFPGEIKVDDACMACDPKTDTLNWSKRTGVASCVDNKTSGSSSTGLIVGLVLLGTACLVVIISGVVYKITRGKKGENGSQASLVFENKVHPEDGSKSPELEKQHDSATARDAWVENDKT